MNEAGFNSGQFQNVQTNYEQLDLILQEKSVGGVSFTGSSAAGAIIASKAGMYLKPSVMELGGNDPFVVLEDANVELAITNAIKSRISNAGQVCCSPKRFIIDKKVYK